MGSWSNGRGLSNEKFVCPKGEEEFRLMSTLNRHVQGVYGIRF